MGLAEVLNQGLESMRIEDKPERVVEALAPVVLWKLVAGIVRSKDAAAAAVVAAD